jgi:hypothetical protein
MVDHRICRVTLKVRILQEDIHSLTSSKFMDLSVKIIHKQKCTVFSYEDDLLVASEMQLGNKNGAKLCISEYTGHNVWTRAIWYHVRKENIKTAIVPETRMKSVWNELTVICSSVVKYKQMNQFCQNLINTWWFVHFQLFYSNFNLIRTRLRYQLLICMYFCLPNIAKPMDIKKLREVILLTMWNSVSRSPFSSLPS